MVHCYIAGNIGVLDKIFKILNKILTAPMLRIGGFYVCLGGDMFHFSCRWIVG